MCVYDQNSFALNLKILPTMAKVINYNLHKNVVAFDITSFMCISVALFYLL
jgi:hypothetical protein